jgi:hypothetical protein
MVHVQRGEVCPTKPPGVSDDRAKSDRGAIPIVWTAPTAWRGAACCQPTELPCYKAAPLPMMMRWAAVTVGATNHQSPLPPLRDSVNFSEWMSVEKIRLDPAELGSIVDLDAHVEIERANGGALVEQNVFSSRQNL